MNTLDRLKKRHTHEMFHPSWLGVLINPFYFSRKYLKDEIQNQAHHMKGRMLELGCGTKPYKNLFNVKGHIGLEIEDGRDHSLKSIDCYYDGKRIPFGDQSFDSFFSSQVFEHIFNLEDIIKEANRVLKKEGKLLVTIPFAWPEHEQPHDFARYTTFGLKNLLERNGFRVILQKKTGGYLLALVQMLCSYLEEKVGLFLEVLSGSLSLT